MKKRIIYLFAILPLLFSCGWEIPQKVSVKTDAEYAFTVGSFEQELSEYINIEKINELMNSKGESSTGSEYALSVYDYNPGGKSDVQQFLIDIPLQDVPLDLGQYLDKLNFTDTMEGINFEKVINTPDFSSQRIDGEVQLPDIKSVLKNIDLASSFKLTGNGNTDRSGNVPLSTPLEMNFTITTPKFKKIYYSSGSLDFTIQKKTEDVSDPLKNRLDFYISNAFLYEKIGDDINIISSANVNSYVTNGKQIQLPLGGKYIPEKVYLGLNGTIISDGVSGEVEFSVAGKVNDSSKISKVTGLDSSGIAGFGSTTESFNQTIRLDNSGEDFISAGVSEGIISIYSKLPDGWSGVEFSRTIIVENPVVTDVDWDKAGEDGNYLVNRKASLAGKVIEKGKNLTVKGDFKFTLNDATIVFNANGDVDNIPVRTDFNLKKLEYLVVDFSKYSENLSTNYSKAFPESVQKFLDWIKIRESGLKVTYTNNLPAGNDLTMKVNSSLMEIADVSKKLSSGTTGGLVTYYGDYSALTELEGKEAVTEKGQTFDVKKIGSDKPIDMKVDIILPDAGDGQPEHAKLVNIDLSREYKINVSVKPEFNWYSLCIKKIGTDDDSGFEGNIETDFGFDKLFGSVVDSFGGKSNDHFFKNLRFESLPCYLYFIRPSGTSGFARLFDDVSLKGKICLKATGCTDKYILGSSSTTGNLVTKSLQSLEKDSNGVVVSYLNEMNSSAAVDISDFLVSGKENLSLSYDMQMTTGERNSEEGIVIKRSEYEEYKAGEKDSSTAASLGVFARIVIPFALNVEEDSGSGALPTKDSFVDIIQIAGMYEDGGDQKDFFGRGDVTDLETTEKYTRIVNSVGLIYNVNNDLFSKNSYIDFGLGNAKKRSGAALDNPEYKISMKSGTLTVTKDDFLGWLNTYPLNPTVKVVIPKNSAIKIPRKAKFGAVFSVILDCDGNEKIELMGGE